MSSVLAVGVGWLGCSWVIFGDFVFLFFFLISLFREEKMLNLAHAGHAVLVALHPASE